MSSKNPTAEVMKLLLPHVFEGMEKVRTKNLRFTHYTSAATAIQIISKKKIWMRNSRLMNDFSEIQHGESCLASSWSDPHVGQRLKAVLERISPGLANDFATTYDDYQNDRMHSSYLISISEIDDNDSAERKYGRLSMWRAYGGNTNVAFVFNNRPFVEESNFLLAYTLPVLYCDRDSFKDVMLKIVDGLEQNVHVLKSITPEAFKNILFYAFHFIALSTKHPGFSEEKEWRIVHSPSFLPSSELSCDIEIINGVPQKVYKLELKDYSQNGLFGVTLPELLEEVIVGPTASPWPIRDALVECLTEAGVQGAEAKVRVSEIPLRR